jgi:hypothetical protein
MKAVRSSFTKTHHARTFTFNIVVNVRSMLILQEEIISLGSRGLTGPEALSTSSWVNVSP